MFPNDEITRFLKITDVEYIENQSLASLSSIKIGGTADIVAYPSDEGKLLNCVGFLEKQEIRYKILGRMSNVLPNDEGFHGVILKTDKLSSVRFNNEIVSSDAGVSLPVLSSLAKRSGLSGLEQLSGIPGSVGGAIYGNAGAFGRGISDVVLSVRAFDLQYREVREYSVKDIGFSYRSSSFQRGGIIILSVMLQLTASTPDDVSRLMRECSEMRRKSQPYGFPSLGSTFKRPFPGLSAGKLIDECGLKGISIGGAKISDKHAGFIINAGGATASDYLTLADTAEKSVYEKYGIKLSKEIEIL